jgi:hypothetical protein
VGLGASAEERGEREILAFRGFHATEDEHERGVPEPGDRLPRARAILGFGGDRRDAVAHSLEVTTGSIRSPSLALCFVQDEHQRRVLHHAARADGPAERLSEVEQTVRAGAGGGFDDSRVRSHRAMQRDGVGDAQEARSESHHAAQPAEGVHVEKVDVAALGQREKLARRDQVAPARDQRLASFRSETEVRVAGTEAPKRNTELRKDTPVRARLLGRVDLARPPSARTSELGQESDQVRLDAAPGGGLELAHDVDHFWHEPSCAGSLPAARGDPMKWLALIVALFVAVPWLAQRTQNDPRLRGWIGTLLGFVIFDPTDMNLISEETYRGDSRGIEITSVDLLMLVLWFSRKPTRPEQAPSWGALWFPRVLYLTAILLSFSASPDWLKSFYSVWKLLRMYVFFSVMAGVLRDPAMLVAVLRGLSLGVLWQGASSLYQKYALHAVRVVGSQSHPNSLAMLVNLVAPIALALVLAGLGDKTAGLVVVSAAMCDVFSLSRGGMMMFVLASTTCVGASIWRRPTVRKFGLVALGGLGALGGIAKGWDTIVNRFLHAPKESEEARVLFNKAAAMMAGDHPFGVGINMYSYSLEHGGYAARLAIDAGDRNGIAHHIYWLTAAETGYFGVSTFVLLLASVLVNALRSTTKPDGRGDIAVGIVAGLVVTYLQGTAEWIARQTNMSYLFWLFAAITVALRGLPPLGGSEIRSRAG